MNISFSANFEAHTLEEAVSECLKAYQTFLGKDVETLPYNSALEVSEGTDGRGKNAVFRVNFRVDDLQ